MGGQGRVMGSEGWGSGEVMGGHGRSGVVRGGRSEVGTKERACNDVQD